MVIKIQTIVFKNLEDAKAYYEHLVETIVSGMFISFYYNLCERFLNK